MRNKMILFFCMLLVSLSVPFPTYAEAGAVNIILMSISKISNIMKTKSG